MTSSFDLVVGMLSIGCHFTLHYSDRFIADCNYSFRDCVSDISVANTNTIKAAPPSDKAAAKFPPGREALQIIVSRGLRRLHQDARHAQKRIAAAIGIEIRTARTYLDGSRTPSAWNLLQLMADSRSIRADIDRLVDELEATNKAPEKNNKSTSYRRDNADARHGFCAETRLGKSQSWSHDCFSIWPRVVLVDVAWDLGRVQPQRESVEAGEMRIGEGQEERHRHDGR